MDISKSFVRRDKGLQLVNRDAKPLTLMDRLKGKSEDIENIEEVIDIDKDMERYQRDTLRKIRPQQVYQMGIFESKSGLYRISREVELSVLTQPVELRVVSKQFENNLRYAGYKYIHQGMYIIGIKGMTRKKLGTKVLITLLDKRWDTINKAALGFLEGDMNENRLITYIAPDLMMPIQEFIEKMSFGFQTKGYEEFKGTNLLVSIEFVGRLTNKSRTRYKVNVNDVIQSMQSKGINFMSPLTISSEERAGEEWNIGELIESKTLQQPLDYISYENNKGSTSIRFINYKPRSLDDMDSVTEEKDKEDIDSRRHSISEFMEKADLDTEIFYCEDKLKEISLEYNKTMTSEWSALREREIYFYRELSRLKRLKREKGLAENYSKIRML